MVPSPFQLRLYREAPDWKGWQDKGFALYYNRIDSGGITRNHCGHPAVPPKDRVVQISIVEALEEVEGGR